MGWKAKLLVTITFGMMAVTSSVAAKLAHGLFRHSIMAGSVVGMLVVLWWWRLFGGFHGLSRALGDGSTSLSMTTTTQQEQQQPPPNQTKTTNCLRCVCISDTHNRHDELKLPDGDVLIHAGDFTMTGTRGEIENFVKWFEQQPYRIKILVPGNHDYGIGQLESNDPLMVRIHQCCTFLSDTSAHLEGGKLRVWGSGRTSWISKRNGMYLQHPAEDLGPFWNDIPADTHIVIVHQPPYLLGDRIFLGRNVGCKFLRQKMLEIRPQVVVSGHIHEAYGTYWAEGVQFINAATCNLLYNPLHPPITFDVVL